MRMADVTIYHNPKCSKSRETLAILEEKGVDCEVIEYLDNPLDRATLAGFLDLLESAPEVLVRKDKRFKELGLNEADYQSPEPILDLLGEHPELMQRPVVLRGGKALITRPADLVNELF